MSLKNEWLFIRARIRPVHVFCIILLSSIFVFWFWYQSIFCALSTRQNILNKNISVLEQQKETIPVLEYRVQELQQQHDDVRVQLQELQHAYAALDPYTRTELFFEDIVHNNLRIVAFAPKASLKKLFYERVLFTIKIAGTFNQIMSFLKTFKKRSQAAKFKEVFIERKKKDVLFQATVALYVIDPEGAHA